MRISYLELRNYRRFKELKLEFPDGIVGILGPNGSGKTTIIEAIAWALFGNVEEVVRTSRESVRMSAASANEACSAILEFELGSDEYRIERAMGGKSLSMKAELRGGGKVLAEGDKEVKKKVESLLGMDYKSFFISVFARQKELDALQNAARGERKKSVLRMLRIDGVDDALQQLRTDKRDLTKRIEGQESTLLTEDGREKENILQETLPVLEAEHGAAVEKLEKAEKSEAQARKELEDARQRRDALKKDVDAYNQSAKDLGAKRSAIAELNTREQKLSARIADIRSALDRLPILEKEEKKLAEGSRRLDELDKEKNRSETASRLAKEIEDLRTEMAQRSEELQKLDTQTGDLAGTEAQKSEADKARTMCGNEQASLAGKIGELRSRRAAGLEAAAKDRKKLDEIMAAGEKGICPTCERALGDAYGLLVSKLKEGVDTQTKLVGEMERAAAALEAEAQGLARKEDALKKKLARLEQEIARQRHLAASVEAGRKETRKLASRLEDRQRALKDLGEVRFSQEEYAKVKKEHDRLRATHDEYVRLKGQQEEMHRAKHELGEVKETIAQSKLEQNAVEAIVRQLEPKKALYESSQKEVDDKTESLSRAKDDLRRLTTLRDRAAGELERTRKELENVRQTKKVIEKDRKQADDLALLEDLMVSFRDHLIGKVAPTLSELTSDVIESMTDGRYANVQLDDNYEMQVEDQGTPYPLSRFSGGESDLANLALRLAISRIIAERTGANPVNMLILDEIFGSQDLDRKRSVMITLSRLSTRFRQIFLITHVDDIKDLIANIVNVEQLPDGTSAAALAG